MRRTRLAAALTVLPLALSTLAFDQAGQVCRTVDPDGVEDNGDEYDLCEVEAFLKEQTTKVGNLSYLPQSPQPVSTWSEEAPTTAFSAGGGGGYLASSVGNAQGHAQAVYEGSFTGELDAIDFDLYLLFPAGDVYQPDDIHIQLEAREPGGSWATVLGMTDQFDVAATYLGGSTNILWQQDFGITGLKKALGFIGLDGDIERELRITVEPHFSDSGNWIYVQDATEVPSALTFNPSSQIFEKVTPKLSAS